MHASVLRGAVVSAPSKPRATTAQRACAVTRHPASGMAGGVPRRSALAVGVLSGATLAGAAVFGLAAAGLARAAISDTGLVTRRGMAKFIKNEVESSIEDFDLVIKLDARQRPYMWQRGLSLYYVERYADGAKQFRDDVAVNPNDTEESIWALLCEARLPGGGGFEAAQREMLVVGRDGRPVMRAAYELFRGSGSMDALRAAAAASPHDEFYSLLYQGLYHEARGDAEDAKAAVVAATECAYGAQSGDYMAALARVHALRRGWLAA